MADEIFGDENNINPSVFKEFERFGANVGMFTGQEPEIDEEINKKYYSTVDKKYVFTTKASMKLPKIKHIIKTEKEEYEEEIIEEKKRNVLADTTMLESEIDKLVYQLYGLSDSDIKDVEDSIKIRD